jgi:hypothetical protein
MAGRHSEELLDLRFDVSWPDRPTSGGVPLFDASVGRLSISIQDVLVTSYKSDKGDVGTELTIPLYNVAEWIVTNWWALLFEPRKSDEEDSGFRSRHWLGYARDGFALPDFWFHPVGDEIEVCAHEKYLRFARLQFLNSATATIPTTSVRAALTDFVEDVLQKMSTEGFRSTEAHEAWDRICHTDPDAEEYCRLVGALGLSPYEEHEDIDRIIDVFPAQTPVSILNDLFQASDDSNLSLLANATERLLDQLPKAPEIDIKPLADIPVPEWSGSAPWQWGKAAARKVRTNFGINSQDPRGGHAFFDKMGIDASSRDGSYLSDFELTVARLSGGVTRSNGTMQIALSERDLARRRFAAARGAFLGWSSEAPSSHLVTTARTRIQQASRAFAAELLAPFDYIRSQAGGSAVSTFRLEEIARDLDVTPAVVKWQAQNNKLHVVDFASW